MGVRQQVGARAEERGLGVGAGEVAHQVGASPGVAEDLRQLAEERRRALDRAHARLDQARVRQLARQVLGAVEVRRGEPAGHALVVPVHARAELAVDDGRHAVVREHVPRQRVPQARPAGDRGGAHDAAGTHHAARLGECSDPLGAFGQVVERAEQEHGVARRVPLGQSARVAHLGRERPVFARLRNVQRHRIDQVDVVAPLGQPARVHARAAADVEDAGGRRRQQLLEQRLRPYPLQLSARAAGQPVAFLAPVVVVGDLLAQPHQPTMPHTPAGTRADYVTAS
ncbi:MAG TPA: hypothetical protein VF053_07585 [Streptosporangiales bacterium]